MIKAIKTAGLAVFLISTAQAYVVCKTTSNSLTFRDAGPTVDFALTQTLLDCTSNNSSSGSDCRANLSCHEDGFNLQKVMVVCSTSSGGLNFRDGSRDTGSAVKQVIDECSQNPKSLGGDCRANVECEQDNLPIDTG